MKIGVQGVTESLLKGVVLDVQEPSGAVSLTKHQEFEFNQVFKILGYRIWCNGVLLDVHV